MEIIFAYIRREMNGSIELQNLVDREKEFDAIGGWLLDSLSLVAFEKISHAVAVLEKDLPNSISHWREERRPLFYDDLTKFKQKLAERIMQLKNNADGETDKRP